MPTAEPIKKFFNIIKPTEKKFVFSSVGNSFPRQTEICLFIIPSICIIARHRRGELRSPVFSLKMFIINGIVVFGRTQFAPTEISHGILRLFSVHHIQHPPLFSDAVDTAFPQGCANKTNNSPDKGNYGKCNKCDVPA